MEQYLKDSPQIKITADIKKITKDFKKRKYNNYKCSFLF